MSGPLTDHELEAEIRAMLQRRALDVNLNPPAWRELAQRNGAVVISLRTGAAIDPAATRRRRGRGWFRPVIAAAVALAVAMAGAVFVGGSGPGHDDTADAPEVLKVPAAGNTNFAAGKATPLFPATDEVHGAVPNADWLGDPTATATQFLGTVGLPVDKDWFLIEKATLSQARDADDQPVVTANVPWSAHPEDLPENPALTDGVVFLRDAAHDGRDTWFVVGVVTFNLRVVDLQRQADLVSFTVDRTVDDSELNEPALVTVDGQVVARVSVGEALPVQVRRPAGQVAIIRVQHMVDGIPWSITTTAVPAMPGAPPPAATTTIASAGVDGVWPEATGAAPPSTVVATPARPTATTSRVKR